MKKFSGLFNVLWRYLPFHKPLKKPSAYHFQGLDMLGIKRKGIIYAINKQNGINLLKHQGILVKKIKPQRYMISLTHLKPFLIVLVLKQLLTLIKNHVPIIQAIEIISSHQKNDNIQQLLEEIMNQLKNGLSLSQALSQHPHYFNALMCSTLALGEQSNRLIETLTYVIDYKVQTIQFQKKIKKALRYPLLLALLGILISFGISFYIMPTFSTLFESFHVHLPFLTQAMLKGSSFMNQYGLHAGIIFLLVILTGWYVYKKNTYVQYIIEHNTLKAPWVGTFIHNIFRARFAQALYITTKAYIPLDTGLNLIAHMMGSTLYRHAIEAILENLAQGFPLHQSVEKTKFFPVMIIQMIKIGEVSGDLEEMLHYLVRYYNEAVNDNIDNMQDYIEPILMIFLGIFTVILMLAIYVPIFQLGSLL